jgi:hypothetical protein
MSDDSTRIIPRQSAEAELAGTPPAPDDGQTIVVPSGGARPPPPTDEGVTVVLGGATLAASGMAPTQGGVAPAADAGSAPEVLAVGTRVGEFEITELVGQGGFGIVYKAWDHTLERVVALKEYLPSALALRRGDGAVTARSERHQETFDAGMRSFINEARLLAQFDHPSLLKVYRFWQDKGTTYMVMPFYRGLTLKETLAARGPRPPQDWLLGVFDSVTQALAVMHGAQCYHRDIAPDNILLLEDTGVPVVLDFGAARRVISDMTQAITVILKPGYAPVEQYAETPDMKQGPWTDVYALGAVLYFAITGKTPVASVGRMLSDSYEPLATRTPAIEGYSVGFLRAIDEALRVRPTERPQSMLELRQLLGLEGGVAPAPRPAAPPMGSAPRPLAAPAAAPRKTGALVAAGLLGLAVLAGGGWWLSQGGKGTAPVAEGGTPAPAPTPAQAAAKRPYSPTAVLQDMVAQASPELPVKVNVAQPVVKVGVDKLGFTVESGKAGHLYIYLASADGNFNLLFPNALDKHNQIEANKPVVLPRPAWALVAGGPVGTDHLVAVVSAVERDHTEVGIQRDSLFSQFPSTAAQAIDLAHTSGPTPFLGKPVCDAGAACDTRYGAAAFEIVQK